jgi:hypothetical protein
MPPEGSDLIFAHRHNAHIARQLQHDVPVPPLDATSTRTSTTDPWTQQTSPSGAESKVGLEVMPTDGVT